MNIPFPTPGATKPEPTTEPQEVPTAAPEVATTTEAKKEKRKVERKATRNITQNDINFVINNIKNMSYGEMAEKLGLTRHQVNRILMDLKKALREEAKKTGREEQVERYIKEHLSRPEEARVGSKKEGEVKKAVSNTVANILNSL